MLTTTRSLPPQFKLCCVGRNARARCCEKIHAWANPLAVPRSEIKRQTFVVEGRTFAVPSYVASIATSCPAPDRDERDYAFAQLSHSQPLLANITDSIRYTATWKSCDGIFERRVSVASVETKPLYQRRGYPWMGTAPKIASALKHALKLIRSGGTKILVMARSRSALEMFSVALNLRGSPCCRFSGDSGNRIQLLARFSMDPEVHFALACTSDFSSLVHSEVFGMLGLRCAHAAILLDSHLFPEDDARFRAALRMLARQGKLKAVYRFVVANSLEEKYISSCDGLDASGLRICGTSLPRLGSLLASDHILRKKNLPDFSGQDFERISKDFDSLPRNHDYYSAISRICDTSATLCVKRASKESLVPEQRLSDTYVHVYGNNFARGLCARVVICDGLDRREYHFREAKGACASSDAKMVDLKHSHHLCFMKSLRGMMS